MREIVTEDLGMRKCPHRWSSQVNRNHEDQVTMMRHDFANSPLRDP